MAEYTDRESLVQIYERIDVLSVLNLGDMKICLKFTQMLITSATAYGVELVKRSLYTCHRFSPWFAALTLKENIKNYFMCVSYNYTISTTDDDY